jgi:Spy/CpxP family protein refolding chaperone
MTIKRLTLWSAGALAVLAVALGSTYMMLTCCRAHPTVKSLDMTGAHRWIHQLHLTEEQKTNLIPLETSLQKDLEPLQMKLADARVALCGVLGDDNADENQVDRYVDQVADLESQQQHRIVRHLWEMRSVLTPEQRKSFFTSLTQAVCENCLVPPPASQPKAHRRRGS